MATPSRASWSRRATPSFRASHGPRVVVPAAGSPADGRAVASLGDFCAVHMTWGAINELTALTGYRRLAAVAGHPVLTELLECIMRDESRHFFFYYRQAELRLRRPGASRVARFLVDRFWGPVGSGVQPRAELEFLGRYLFAGPEGRAAARKVDETIRRLPGFDGVQLLEGWMDRNGGRHDDDGDH